MFHQNILAQVGFLILLAFPFFELWQQHNMGMAFSWTHYMHLMAHSRLVSNLYFMSFFVVVSQPLMVAGVGRA